MAKHTEGPWFIKQPDDMTPHLWIDAKANVGIAKIECCDYGDGLGHRLTDDDQANARLIAAAPDLLEALEDAERALVACNFDPTSNTMRDIRAAIAKATK